MRTIVIGAVLALALMGQASAQSHWRANELLPACRTWGVGAPSSHQEAYDEGVCVGIITGEVFASHGFTSNQICEPRGVTNSQMVAVVVRYIEQHPQDMHLPFALLAFRALHEAWPCELDQADK